MVKTHSCPALTHEPSSKQHNGDPPNHKEETHRNTPADGGGAKREQDVGEQEGVDTIQIRNAYMHICTHVCVCESVPMKQCIYSYMLIKILKGGLQGASGGKGACHPSPLTSTRRGAHRHTRRGKYICTYIKV